VTSPHEEAAYFAGYMRACADHDEVFWASWAEEGFRVWCLRPWAISLLRCLNVLSPAPADGSRPTDDE